LDSADERIVLQAVRLVLDRAGVGPEERRLTDFTLDDINAAIAELEVQLGYKPPTDYQPNGGTPNA
jgi:hypothetical protein